MDINRQIKPNIISIHVPAWGTTVHRRNIMMLILISIHVPAWGTTNWQNNIFYELIYFNPRSRVGNDQVFIHNVWNSKDFNPRSRVGNDGFVPGCPRLGSYFNPRSRVGNDSIEGIKDADIPISIHVPAWGTTHTYCA